VFDEAEIHTKMSTLTDLLPERTDDPDARLRVVDVDDEEADAVFDALSSETRRGVYRYVFDSPATASELADRLDTSLQNVTHHVAELERAELIEPIGHRYSETGNEMTVYGPASDPLVLVGREDLRPHITGSLSRLAGGIGILAAASLLFQWGIHRLASPPSAAGSTIEPASHGGTAETTSWLTWFVFEAGEPGLVFFFACLAVAGFAAVLTRPKNG
jgi:DNA-binding transcriptional ArsR family regulator